MTKTHLFPMAQETRRDRAVLAIVSAVYLAWWEGVELLLPDAYNPFWSRFFVCAAGLGIVALSFGLPIVRDRLRLLVLAVLWGITAHYFYLFVMNGGDANWVVGALIAVIALNLAMYSVVSLALYSAFVLALSAGCVVLLPGLSRTIFLPGMLTIILQANVALRFGLKTVKRLEESNERFRMIFHSTFEGVFVDRDGVIQIANTALSELLGYPVGGLVGRRTDEFFDRLEEHSAGPFETTARRRDGSTVELEARTRRYDDRERPGRLTTVSRIEDRRRAEKAQALATAMGESVRVRDDFISVASHELRTPLTSLILQTQFHRTQLAAHKPGADDPAQFRAYLGIVDRQVTRLTRLVESMLDVSRISSGKFRVDRAEVDVARLVREVADLHRPPAGTPGPIISVTAPESLRIPGDPYRLEQVIENLFGNALKYGAGKPIELRVAREDGFARIEVRDHGLGISPENLPKVFDRFERVISSENIGGLGLGLYISRQIVQSHGGTISVESRLGEGSTFTVRLPT